MTLSPAQLCGSAATSSSSSVTSSPLGLIGLGLVGSALAERFHRAGLVVHGHDIDAAALLSFAEHGMAHPTSLVVAQRCRRIVLSLPTDATVRQVVAEIEAALQPGDILVDTTTGE